MSHPFPRRLACLLLTLLTCAVHADTTLAYPEGRDAFATTEDVILAVTRATEAPLGAGALQVTLRHADGDGTTFSFPLAAAEATTRTEFVAFNGRLLRPGAYTVAVTADGSSAESTFTLHSLVPWTSYALANWGSRGKDADNLRLVNELRYTVTLNSGATDQTASFIRAGIQQAPCCIMGGGHQMDLRLDASWADPYVLQGGRRRAASYAVAMDRNPTLIGIHFYDEPGLTWHKHPVSGEFTPHGVPAQVRAYEASFGEKPIDYTQVDPANPAHVAAWMKWSIWKLSIMEAAWTDATQAVDYVDPSLLSINQSQYGWSAFTDGYYFNIQRQQPVVLGHGGYHDLNLGYWTPNQFLEAALARESKPVWYLPTWYGNTTADELKLEQYLAFMMGIHGLMTPPPLDPLRPNSDAAVNATIAATNDVMGRIGPAFTQMQPERAPIGLLYSMSYLLHNQVSHMDQNYAHATPHGASLNVAFLALKQLHMPFEFIVEEDILDGSATAKKVILITSVDYLDPTVLSRLQAYIAGGGTVLLSGDCTLDLPGARKIAPTPDLAGRARIAEIIPALGGAAKEEREALLKELHELSCLRTFLQASEGFMPSMREAFSAAGVTPAVLVDQPGVAVNRLTDGDISYSILVNATHDFAGDNPRLGLKAVSANASFANDGRPVYDVMQGKAVTLPGDKNLVAALQMQPGDMAIYARTARPIGGFAISTPSVRRAHTSANPLSVQIRASLLDTQHGLLDVAVPVKVVLTAPNGAERYSVYRATAHGLLSIDLPLAENDPSGDWTVTLTDGVAGTSASSTFAFAGRMGGAEAGTVHRALFTEKDRVRIHRLARVHDSLTIVPGSAPHEQAAAERLQRHLSPWGLEVHILAASEAAKARVISEEAASTFIGLSHTPKDSVKPGTENNPLHVGYAVSGPVLLIGTAKTHPLIAALDQDRFRGKSKLYVPPAGRAHILWTYEYLRSRQEAIVLLAADAAAADEGAGSLYEIIAGMRPLTPYALPTTVAPAP